nr:hypothetical protein [Escherichia coli]
MSELGKWKNRVEAQNNKKKPLMPKSKQLQLHQLKQSNNHMADSDDTETTTLSESTICLLIDRFAPL